MKKKDIRQNKRRVAVFSSAKNVTQVNWKLFLIGTITVR